MARAFGRERARTPILDPLSRSHLNWPNVSRKSEADQAGILLWGRIGVMVAEAVTPLLIVRILDKPQFGAFAALMLIYSTVAVVLTAGFPTAVLYFLADASPSTRRATMRLFNRVMIGAGVLMGLGLGAAGWFGPALLVEFGARIGSSGEGVAKDLHYLPLLGLFAVFDLPTRLMANLLLAEDRARTSAGIGIIRSLTVTVATLVPAALGYGVGGIMVGIVAAGFGHAMIYVGIMRSLYEGVEPVVTPLSVRTLLAYCIPLGATQIAITLNSSLDQWLIISLFPVERVAIYKSGAYQLPLITTIAYSVGAVYMPRFTKLFNEQKARAALEIWRGSCLKVSLIVVPTALAFIVAAEEFTVLAFTVEYAEAAGVFRAYCFLVLARVTAFGAVMMAAGKPSYVLRSSVLTLLANLVISVPLTWWLGFYGPAIGTVVAFVPTLCFYNWYIAKAAGVSFRETFPLLAYLKIVAVALIPTAGAVAFKLGFDAHPALMFAGEVAIVALGWALIGTMAGLIEDEDWGYVRRWARLDVLK